MHRPLPYRGVNLGNWLVLERWMSPKLFDGTNATDEYSFSVAHGAKAESLLQRHRETFITREDFRWLRDHGLNAVRIPFGYWLLNPEPPFVSGAKWLDQALDWCEEFGLAANLDIHGLPGFQGPEHHSGREKHFQWGNDPAYLPKSLDFVEQVAQRYKDRACVKLYSIVNEPDLNLPADFLRSFNASAYERIRRHMPAGQVAVVIAAFTEARLPELHRHLKGADNVLTDIHPYPCFGNWRADQLVDYLAWGVAAELPKLRQFGPHDLVIGEWSLGVSKEIMPALKALPPKQLDFAMRTFAANQLLAFDQTAGWFFWSYKVETANAFSSDCWGFRRAVERGWLPDSFGDVA